jgi:hypothetical protein
MVCAKTLVVDSVVFKTDCCSTALCNAIALVVVDAPRFRTREVDQFNPFHPSNLCSVFQVSLNEKRTHHRDLDMTQLELNSSTYSNNTTIDRELEE